MLERAARWVRRLQIDSTASLEPVVEGPPTEIEPDVLTMLRNVCRAGGRELVEAAIANMPADLRWLYESGAITLEQLGSLHDRFGVVTLADIAAVVDQHEVPSAAGLAGRDEQAISAALVDLRRSGSRVPLGQASALIEPIFAALRSLPEVEWVSSVGSLRRGDDTVGDIELVAAAAEPSAAVRSIAHWPGIDRIVHAGERRVYFVLNRAQIGVRFSQPANAGAGLLYLTGSRAHFKALQARAAARGWRLTASGLSAADGSIRQAATEEEIYGALALPFIPPEIREGDEAIAAADRGALPSLVTQADIRGDLHMHSAWSDGRDPIEAMVSTCRALGYEYVAITDHSPSSGASRKLSVDTVARQAEEIEALRDKYPDITILHGCEVDILPSGQLDFPDSVLERFDIVLASLHHAAGHSPDRLLRRYLAAMHHPLVALITHPTNRFVAARPGYDLDYERLFEAAVETGTLLEIDGAPAHLDMHSALARRAVAAGVTVAVNSDCHRSDRLELQMRLGVVTARRGWVPARNVANTRPLAAVRGLIARKRGT